jgi:hypothetical protein
LQQAARNIFATIPARPIAKNGPKIPAAGPGGAKIKLIVVRYFCGGRYEQQPQPNAPMTAPIANDPSDVEDLDSPDDVQYLAAFSQFFAVSRDLAATLDTALAGIIQGINADAGALFLGSGPDKAFSDAACAATPSSPCPMAAAIRSCSAP